MSFFSESEIPFSNLPISQNNYSKKLYWSWNLNKLFTDMGGNFKLRIVFWNNVFGRLGDLKKESHFLKKGTFSLSMILLQLRTMERKWMYVLEMHIILLHHKLFCPTARDQIFYQPAISQDIFMRLGDQSWLVSQSYCVSITSWQIIVIIAMHDIISSV